jgi:hypothetical protein
LGRPSKQTDGGLAQILRRLGGQESVKDKQLVAEVNQAGVADGGTAVPGDGSENTFGQRAENKVL